MTNKYCCSNKYLPPFSINYCQYVISKKCMLGKEADSGGNSRSSHGYAVTVLQNVIGMRGDMRCDGRGLHCAMDISFRENHPGD